MALTIDFAGRVAVITGGTKGVGRGIARRFADAGATVVVCARSIPDDLPTGWHGETVDLLRQRYAAEKARLEAEREAKKDRIRGA